MTQPILVGGNKVGAGNRRTFILMGVGVGLLLVALVLPKLLFGGGSADPGGEALTAPPVAATPGGVATPAPGTTVTSDPGAVPPPETTEVFSTKNPFTPLVDTSPGATGATTGTGATEEAGATTPGTVATTPLDPVTPTSPTIPATDAEDAAGGATPRTAARVSLVDVVDDAGTVRATVLVNGASYTVAEGEEFASSYRAVTLSASEGCGQFLYGDESFRVCRGEELLK